MIFIYILVGIGAIIIVWTAVGYITSRAEESIYTVREKKDRYEIRVYPSQIIAQTTATGTYKEALNTGFSIIAKFIFGANTKKESIAMTVPVVEQKKQSEKIAMTVPVLASIEGEEHTITFAMPRAYTLETLPTPIDPRVKIITVPERTMAAMRFGGFRSNERVVAHKELFLTILKKDGYTNMGEPSYAGYDAPWSPPWLMRNEILVALL